jgi:hypothetical protein
LQFVGFSSVLTWVFVVLGALVVFAIAAAVVGREAGLLDREPPRSVFDMDEAVKFVADRLPDEVTAALSHDDVAAIVGWHLDYFEAEGLLVGPGAPLDGSRISEALVSDDGAVAFVLGRAGADRADAAPDFTDDQIASVVHADTAYLRAIGAIGGEV